MGYPVLNALIALNSPLKSRYEHSLTCSSLINCEDGKLTSRYCKRSWCSVCNPIRTAVRINNYRESLEALDNLQLTTLTVPNVPGNAIRKTIQYFKKVFRQYRDTYNKKNTHLFSGVYNIEITFNSSTRLFHPHIHIIHKGIDTIALNGKNKEGKQKLTNSLINYWLKKNSDCKMVAQDTRQCTDLVEGFKYQSKSIFNVKVNGKREPYIPAKELDIIYNQIAGLRCFQSFGIEKVVTDIEEEKQMEELTAYEVDVKDNLPAGGYLWKNHDWILQQYVDAETGEVLNYLQDDAEIIDVPLSKYKPDKKTIAYREKLMSNEFNTT